MVNDNLANMEFKQRLKNSLTRSGIKISDMADDCARGRGFNTWDELTIWTYNQNNPYKYIQSAFNDMDRIVGLKIVNLESFHASKMKAQAKRGSIWMIAAIVFGALFIAQTLLIILV